MRIVIDMQAVQSASGRRGIGRYSSALVRSMVRQASHHEIILALNGSIPGSIEPLRTAFHELLDQTKIRVWQGLDDVAGIDPAKRWRRQTAERIREAFLASLAPDVVYVASLFEGLIEDATTSIGTFCPTLTTAATLFDLIPLVYREQYLREPAVAQWYETKLSYLRRADLLLAISEASRLEAVELLGIPVDRIANISAAADECFRPLVISAEEEVRLRRRFGLHRPFVLYVGGMDYRKNVEGLLRAFALLPGQLLQSHQLALAWDIEPDARIKLLEIADQHGLGSSQVVFTGFVSDEELVRLYNMCVAFCLPSLHEGFGLPLLEAMACGAAVIAANSSSLPEVVGRADALFAPKDDGAIAARLHQVLSDEAFRMDLRSYGPLRAAQFSWDSSARRALEAIEACAGRALSRRSATPILRRSRERLIFVSPMPPEQTGIADYSAELLEELTAYYNIDIVVRQDAVDRASMGDSCAVRTLDWFKHESPVGERILYQFGNSPFHTHMFEMLEHHPGVVVLHDFFLSGIISYREAYSGAAHAWTEALYNSHGYRAVAERFTDPDPQAVVWKYPGNLAVLQIATGIIVHSNFSRQLARQWFGDALPGEWIAIPQPHRAAPQIDRKRARSELNLQPQNYVVCSFGLIDWHKSSHQVLTAWLESRLASEKSCQLIFVGDCSENVYNRTLIDKISASGMRDRIRVTGFVPPDIYCKWLASADGAVQLRTNSRGETSRAALDCMSYGVPIVVNRHGPMSELPPDSVIMIEDDFTNEELVQALELGFLDVAKRQSVAKRARAAVEEIHSPRKVASLYFDAIEHFHDKARRGRAGLIASVANQGAGTTSDHDWYDTARSIAQSLPLATPERQLLVDVSALVQDDLGTGIQRVVRNVLKYLIDHPRAGFRIEPVYATQNSSYRYARRFTLRLLGCPDDVMDDDWVDFGTEDVFLGLDWHPFLVADQAAALARMRESGIKIYFVIYDLLSSRMPQFFPQAVVESLDPWLRVVTASEGAICISKAVADELHDYVNAHVFERSSRFKIGWFHLGADALTEPYRCSTYEVLAANGNVESIKAPFILMVGTIEPRKGYAQALAAFEELWVRGVDVRLVIVGKQGWMVERLVERIREHPQLDRKLIWYSQVGDGIVEALYKTANGLLVASEGEGFGLPLIEAAYHGCPILTRDIPVFREVAQEYATYFRGTSSTGLADAVENWLAALEIGNAPTSSGMPIRTWAESAEQLLSAILDNNWYIQFDLKPAVVTPPHEL